LADQRVVAAPHSGSLKVHRHRVLAKNGVHTPYRQNPSSSTIQIRSFIRASAVQTGLGLSPGRPRGRPGTFSGGFQRPLDLATLSEVMASGSDVIKRIKERIQEVD